MSPARATVDERSWLLRLRTRTGVLGPMRGGELLVAFGALLLAVFVSVGLLKLTITSEATTTAVPKPRIAQPPLSVACGEQ